MLRLPCLKLSMKSLIDLLLPLDFLLKATDSTFKSFLIRLVGLRRKLAL